MSESDPQGNVSKGPGSDGDVATTNAAHTLVHLYNEKCYDSHKPSPGRGQAHREAAAQGRHSTGPGKSELV